MLRLARHAAGPLRLGLLSGPAVAPLQQSPSLLVRDEGAQITKRTLGDVTVSSRERHTTSATRRRLWWAEPWVQARTLAKKSQGSSDGKATSNGKAQGRRGKSKAGSGSGRQSRIPSKTLSLFQDIEKHHNESKVQGDQALTGVLSTIASAAEDEFFLLPMGGSEEIGMNCNVYINQGRFLMVDLGIELVNMGQGSASLLPDIDFVQKNKHLLDGLVITHAHEDHIGAVATLWPTLDCPLYCSPFTAALIRSRLGRNASDANIHVIDHHDPLSIGPFSLRFQHMTHSIPESKAVIIHTPHGHIMHTGDWNRDLEPIIGQPFGDDDLKKLGDEGVLVVVGDSTNAVRDGETTPESAVQKGLTQRLMEAPLGRQVVMATFSSNIARVTVAVDAANKAGRVPILAGASMQSSVAAAKSAGYLQNLKGDAKLFDVRTADKLHAGQEYIVIATGCQGEPSSALSRIASGDHPHIHLVEDDVVIFSSRTIPGNEQDVQRIVNTLRSRGIHVIQDGDDDVTIHASGHALKGDIEVLFSHLRPKMVIPVHGEFNHLEAHCSIAKACGVQHTLLPHNGNIIRLCGGSQETSSNSTSADGTGRSSVVRAPEVVGQVPTRKLMRDGLLLRPLDSTVIRYRAIQQTEGTCFVTMFLDSAGKVAAPTMITERGLICDTETALQDQFQLLPHQIDVEVHKFGNMSDALVKTAVKRAVHAFCREELGKLPFVEVHLVRLPAKDTAPCETDN